MRERRKWTSKYLLVLLLGLGLALGIWGSGFLVKRREAAVLGRTYRVQAIVYRDLAFDFDYVSPDLAPKFIFDKEGCFFVQGDRLQGEDVYEVGRLVVTEPEPEQFDSYFRNKAPGAAQGAVKEAGPGLEGQGAAAAFDGTGLRAEAQRVWFVGQETGRNFYFLILLKNGDLYLLQGLKPEESLVAWGAADIVRWVFKLEPDEGS